MNKDDELILGPYDLARTFLAERYVYEQVGDPILKLRWWQAGFYSYYAGSYSPRGDGDIKAELAEWFHNSDITLSVQKINLVLLCLQSLCKVAPAIELNSWLDGVNGAKVIPAANGNISLTDLDEKGRPRLLSHSAQYFTLTKLPYDYDVDAECPDWLIFLDDVMQGREDYILLLQQWCGYLFQPDLRQQRFLLCTGGGSNGKGVFFEVVQALVGKQNCSQVSLSRFGQPFALYAMLGKVLNATNESSHIIQDEAENTLKTLVAGDQFTFERKFKESISATPTAKIMIATNSLPRFKDKTLGTWRRILLIPFNKTVSEDAQIKDLAELLKEELPGILCWALEGLDSLNRAGRFTVPDDNAELIEQYRRDSDPARAFLLEYYTTSPNGDGVPCGELYKTYSQWCDDNGCRRMNEATFGQQVRRIFPEVKKRRLGSRDSRQTLYQGLVAQVSQVSQEIPI